MADTPTCFDSLQVCAMRIALLGSNGVPLAGATNGYGTDALINVDISLDIEAAEEKTKKNGCGSTKQHYIGDDKIKGAKLGMALCELDLQLAAMMCGGDMITRLSDDLVFGWQWPKLADAAPYGVCLEVWTKAWDGNSQAILDIDVAYWHWVFPKVKMQLADHKLEDDFLEFALKGSGLENPEMSHAGPFQDWPSDIVALGGITSAGGLWLENDLPTSDCDFIVVPAQVS